MRLASDHWSLAGHLYTLMVMQTYIATFPAGCFMVVTRRLKQFAAAELGITWHDESAVGFWATVTPERLIELRFFTNVYLVIDETRLEAYASFIKGRGYRLMASKDGNPVALPPAQRERLAGVIEGRWRLNPGASGYRHDVVVVQRGGHAPVLTLRLPRAAHKRRRLPAGALRPELAHILLLVAGIRAKDTLLDPFAGYSSILTEAKEGFGVSKRLAVEKDPRLVVQLQLQSQVMGDDAVRMDAIPDASVDRVVTDPPWGLYEPDQELPRLYGLAMKEIYRVLKPQGVVVVLSGNPVFTAFVQSEAGFKQLKQFPVLVSGKKATIIKLQK